MNAELALTTCLGSLTIRGLWSCSRQRSAIGGRGGPILLARANRRGKVALDCRRCLSDTTADVTDEVHLIFAEAGDQTTRMCIRSTCRV